MGIPCYFSKLIRKFPKILKKFSYNNNIKDFYLDSNSIIYDIIHSLENKEEENIIKNVIYKLEEYINTIQPKRRIMIAFDGVAPNAKLHQQRERRYKSYITNKIIPEENKWNTCKITPGTEFMKKLMSEIENHFKNLYPKLETIVSTSNEPGEGEHKIFDKIRESYKTGTTMVYGIDADLIMLCLSNKCFCEDIVLFRETPFFIKNINRNIEPNELYYIKMSELGKAVDSILNKKNSELDYIFLMFLLGNDFMPHFPSLNIRTAGMDILLEAYEFCNSNYKGFQLIDENKKICWEHLDFLLTQLADDERSNIIDEIERKTKKMNYNSQEKKNELQNKYLNIPSELRNIEKMINPSLESWESRYYSLLLNMDETWFFKNKLCLNFYKTLYWTFKYYTSGCIDWTWTYDYPYPPLLADLIKVKPVIDGFKQNTSAIKPNEQLKYVVPPDSINLLENSKDKAQKREEFKNMSVKYDWSFCRYIWEGHMTFTIPV